MFPEWGNTFYFLSQFKGSHSLQMLIVPIFSLFSDWVEQRYCHMGNHILFSFLKMKDQFLYKCLSISHSYQGFGDSIKMNGCMNAISAVRSPQLRTDASHIYSVVNMVILQNQECLQYGQSPLHLIFSEGSCSVNVWVSNIFLKVQ